MRMTGRRVYNKFIMDAGFKVEFFDFAGNFVLDPGCMFVFDSIFIQGLGEIWRRMK